MNTQGISLNPQEMALVQEMLNNQGTNMPQIDFAILGTLALIILIFFLWSLIWKGIALWRAGRDNSKGWFIAILVLNTLGLLEIIYLLFFSSKRIVGKRKEVKVTETPKIEGNI